MKTSITIFIFLLQAFFISASAMNETAAPADTTSEIQVIILNDDSELVGKVTAQTKDSIYIVTDSGMTVQIPISKIHSINNQSDFPKNSIFIEVGSIIISGFVNLNYERMITDHIGLRVGYGYGYYFHLDFGGNGYTEYLNGLDLSFDFLSGEGDSKFEFDIGLCYARLKKWEEKSVHIYPVVEINYRYQPRFGGIFFRIGLGYIGIGGGINMSLGYTF